MHTLEEDSSWRQIKESKRLRRVWPCPCHHFTLLYPVPQVGLPAKSAVSGAILLVVPNVMGMMCLSPPLDKLGNSQRGIDFCQVSCPVSKSLTLFKNKLEVSTIIRATELPGRARDKKTILPASNSRSWCLSLTSTTTTTCGTVLAS